MKNKDIYREIGNVDEKYIREADPTAPTSGVKRRKLTVLAACISVFAVFLSLWLFLPFSGELEDLSKYSNSEYYGLMLKVQELACRPANYRYANNFEKYVMSIGRVFDSATGESAVPNASMDLNVDKYEEVTDNQYDGVIEGDLFKRSDKNIFYLDPYNLILYSYSIEGECKLDEFNVREVIGKYAGASWESEIFLSPDCTKVTVLIPAYNKTIAVMLDVTDAAYIKEAEVVEISGSVISSRMKDGKLLLITGMPIYNEPDFSDESEFLPQITKNGECESLAAPDILYNEDCTNAYYTVAVMLDAESLDVLGSLAVLDNAWVVSVSENNIFLGCNFYGYTEESGENDNEIITKNINQTNIYTISYSSGTLENKGVVRVDGFLNDQYSLDEKDGVLRVVTETHKRIGKRYLTVDKEVYSYVQVERYNSADLYCIDLSTLEIIGSVIGFAPEGEQVASVRFDGDSAYVCTAVVVSFTDPVFFFDLSDMSNITYTDTGVIEGFSTSLIELDGGYLLGIGYGNTRDHLKLEIYEEKNGMVVSVCTYELRGVEFSEDYKSYYINRKDNLFGLMTSKADVGDYILVHFNGGAMVPVANVRFDRVSDEGVTRATIVDGKLFVFASEGQFKATKLEQ
ncbi:MAG: beta-propeller domain-containing protein [Clostridia bacterium]|nr:beta-propeller domain-containing protein [Clostridia bacterium]